MSRQMVPLFVAFLVAASYGFYREGRRRTGADVLLWLTHEAANLAIQNSVND